MIKWSFWKREPSAEPATAKAISPKGLEEILWGINKSPLPAELKTEMKRKVLEEKDEFNLLLQKRVYAAPEVNFPGEIADKVMELCYPILKQTYIQLEYLRDTNRHIYEAIGGKKPVDFEIKVDYRRSPEDK